MRICCKKLLQTENLYSAQYTKMQGNITIYFQLSKIQDWVITHDSNFHVFDPEVNYNPHEMIEDVTLGVISY